ncbi:HEAT repeat domain-containing protein [Corallococcus sp. 4LFB]|uniref:HEAT repeat domain-containing protein n=1 Tax=Corallococcus sp. 4LFB TaxID=3383249 RepID=UPI003975F1BB
MSDTRLTPEQRDTALKDLLGSDLLAMGEASKLLSFDASTTSVLLPLLDGESRIETRHAILYALTWHGDLTLWSLMVGILTDTQEAPQVRGQAAEYLSYNFAKVRTDSAEFEVAVKALLDALKDPSVEVRYCAVNALGCTGHLPLIPTLEEMREDKTPAPGWVGTVSDEASRALEWIVGAHEMRIKRGIL